MDYERMWNQLRTQMQASCDEDNRAAQEMLDTPLEFIDDPDDWGEIIVRYRRDAALSASWVDHMKYMEEGRA